MNHQGRVLFAHLCSWVRMCSSVFTVLVVHGFRLLRLFYKNQFWFSFWKHIKSWCAGAKIFPMQSIWLMILIVVCTHGSWFSYPIVFVGGRCVCFGPIFTSVLSFFCFLSIRYLYTTCCFYISCFALGFYNICELCSLEIVGRLLPPFVFATSS